MPPNPKKPYLVTVYLKSNKRIIELRPRHGIWSPFIFTIPADQFDIVNPELYYGAKNNLDTFTPVNDFHVKLSVEGKLLTFFSANAASKEFSYYIMCNRLPSSIIFGQLGEEYFKELTK